MLPCFKNATLFQKCYLVSKMLPCFQKCYLVSKKCYLGDMYEGRLADCEAEWKIREIRFVLVSKAPYTKLKTKLNKIRFLDFKRNLLPISMMSEHL